jgi:tetratricopeptide (TPR) repeat protein
MISVSVTRALLSALVILSIVSPVVGQGSDPKLAEAGWQALKQGDGNRAATMFREALKRSPRDPILLFGSAAADHLLGRDDDAAVTLRAALKIDPKLAAAATLLGEIEYAQGNLDEAIRFYEQALPFAGAAEGAINRRLEKWRKEAGVHERLTELNAGRFSIVFNGRADPTLASHTVAKLERSFWHIAEKLGGYPSNRIQVILYTEQQFRDITQAPAWAAGQFDGKIRVSTKGVAQSFDNYDRLLAHELTHAIIHGLAATGVPAWLHEGLASYFEPRDPAAAQLRLQSIGVAIPFAALQDGFGRLDAGRQPWRTLRACLLSTSSVANWARGWPSCFRVSAAAGRSKRAWRCSGCPLRTSRGGYFVG